MTDRGISRRKAAVALVLASMSTAAGWAQQDPWSSAGVQVLDSSSGGGAGESKREQVDRIQTRYREILSSWVAGEVDRAPDDLIELEKGVVADGDPKSRKRLLQSEQAVIHELGATSLEVLVPIAMLHHEAYSRLLSRGIRQAPLAVIHARQMARDLAILYNQQSGSEGSAMVASRVLTSLGGMLMEHAQQLPAAELFYQALELDGRNVPARLALATVYEKNAQPESAVKALRELLKLDPDHSEARFRLAMNLKRMGETVEAKKILNELAAAKDAGWVGPLVYQELSRLYAEGEDWADAEKVLRNGLGRYPDHVRLHLELASVLDRRGSFGEAKTLLQKIVELPAGSGGVSADNERLLYNSVRPETFLEARSILEDNSRSRLSVLAQALGTPAAGGEGGR
ncbi:MAG: tetratricopeptide repeat protein [Thermoanaerobaculia bacterium]